MKSIYAHHIHHDDVHLLHHDHAPLLRHGLRLHRGHVNDLLFSYFLYAPLRADLLSLFPER